MQNYAFYIDDLRIARKIRSPGNFTLQYPENQAVNISATNTFIWEASEDAAQYRILVDDNNDFSSPAFDQSVVGAVYTEVYGLEYNKQYYWKVNAINAIGETLSNETFSFTTLNPVKPGNFTLLAPENYSANTALKPTLTWNPSSNSSKYVVLLDNNSSFLSPVTLDNVSTTEFIVQEELEYDKEYFWKIIAINEVGETECGEVYSFRTQPRYYIEQISMTDFFGNPITEKNYHEYIRVGVRVTCNVKEIDPIVIVIELIDSEGSRDNVYVKKQMEMSEIDTMKADFSLPQGVNGYCIRAYVCASR